MIGPKHEPQLTERKKEALRPAKPLPKLAFISSLSFWEQAMFCSQELGKMKLKIVFFGQDKYSVLVLNKLCNERSLKIKSVITSSSPSPVEDYAKVLFEIKFTAVKKFDKDFSNNLKKQKADVGILASFGKILPKEILNIPKHGILNIHPSLLPKYRGPTPVPSAILAGNKTTGVTIIKMDEKVDHGPIIAQFKEEILPKETADDLLTRLFEAGADALITLLPAYIKGKITPRSQNHKEATFTKTLTRDDGKINWSKPPEFIERQIRAYYPWPGSWTGVKLNPPARFAESRRAGEAGVKSEKLKVKRLKILKSHLESGKLVLDQVQLEGKKPVTFKQFHEGYPGVMIKE
jgi:methionyl-tRNA formyltransferase